MGCAISARMKLVTSTMLLIGLRPIASSRYCSQGGLGRTVTFSKTSALYRGHRSRFSMATAIGAGPAGASAILTGSRSGRRRMAATSRAMP